MDSRSSNPTARAANECLSLEQRRLLKQGMDKLYPVVRDTDFAALIDRFKKSDDH